MHYSRLYCWQYLQLSKVNKKRLQRLRLWKCRSTIRGSQDQVPISMPSGLRMTPMRGYVKRPNCVPTWVKQAKAAEQNDQQLDAFTGATPKTGGTQIFTWDFTDQQGKAVKKGTYKVFVEATLYQASDIIYTGTFSTKDKAGEIKLTSTLTEPDEKHKDMVTNVKAVLK